MIRKSILIETYRMKKAYQKSLAIGFAIAASVQLSVAIGVLLYSVSNCSGPENIIYDKPGPLKIYPPALAESGLVPERIRIGAPAKNEGIGVPTPVPDNQAPEDVTVPTMNELSILMSNLSIDDIGSGVMIDTEQVYRELLPPPDVFIPVDNDPVKISEVKPVYPDLARRAGLEAEVWLKVLVDKEGQVRDVLVMKSDNPNLGFEEAAIASARQAVYKPAVSNGIPVAVWVSYAVKFRLR